MYAVVLLAALLLTLSPAHARALLMAALPQPVPAQPCAEAAESRHECEAEAPALLPTVPRTVPARSVLPLPRQAVVPARPRTLLLPASPNAP